MRDYTETLARIDVRAAPGVADEIARVTAAVEGNPGRLLAFCKGDQNLPNDYLRSHGKPRMFDYGSGGLRHAFIEGMAARMTWGCIMRLPQDLPTLMEEAYRERLAIARPEIRDGGLYRSALSDAAARWHVLHVLHRLPEALVTDRPRGPTSLRQQVVAWISAFAQLSEELGLMQALGTSARAFQARLGRLWPPEVMQLPDYPVLRR